jgi:hypothetical protein
MEQAAELKDLMLRVYQALESADNAFFDRYASSEEGLLAIGSDPTEWWAGKATFTRVLKAQLKELGGFPFIAGDPQAYREGTVGWARGSRASRLLR